MSYSSYAFDAYGTLFDVHSAVRRHADKAGPDGGGACPNCGAQNNWNIRGF
ncbi:haloacid dehalogenase, type II [Brucella vulpis]|nr:haloacid dehalogenase, type II [Brucella vulpis]